jgi:hypothetical protein
LGKVSYGFSLLAGEREFNNCPFVSGAESELKIKRVTVKPLILYVVEEDVVEHAHRKRPGHDTQCTLHYVDQTLIAEVVEVGKVRSEEFSDMIVGLEDGGVFGRNAIKIITHKIVAQVRSRLALSLGERFERTGIGNDEAEDLNHFKI